MPSSGLINTTGVGDLVQSPAYNPASPQYAPVASATAADVGAASNNSKSASKFQPSKHATIKEEVNEHSD